MCVVMFPMSFRELVFLGWWIVHLWTPLCYFFAILHLLSQSLSIVLQCGGQLLNITFSVLSARCIRWPGFVPIRVSYCCVINVVWLGLVCCARLIRTLIIVCSASFHVLLDFDFLELRPQLIHWNLKYHGVERPNLLGLSCWRRFDCGMTFHTLCDTGTLDGFKGAVNRWLLLWVVFSSIFRCAAACGVAKIIRKQIHFYHLSMCRWY